MNSAHLFFLCSLLLLGSCANQVKPSGGIKDTIPPSLVSSTPPQEATNFSQQTIRWVFDEYFTLNNAQQNILVSPPLLSPFEIKIKGKSLIFNINDAVLRPQTTYRVFMNEVIQDITESNKITNFEFVFSTGPIIDSLSLKGKVYLAETGEPVKNLLILLYDSPEDSLFRKSKPVGITKCDANGFFTISYLKAKPYYIYALEDLNFSYSYDQPNEKIAFLPHPVYPSDSLPTSISLRIFQEKDSVSRVTNFITSLPGRIKLMTNQPINDFNLNQLASFTSPKIELSGSKDTITIWYTGIKSTLTSLSGHLNSDSFFLTTTLSAVTADTLSASLSPFGLFREKTDKRVSQSQGIKKVVADFSIPFNRPIDSLSAGKIYVLDDSSKQNIPGFRFLLDSTDIKKLKILPPKEKLRSKTLGLVIPRGSMYDLYQKGNDSLYLPFEFLNQAELGSISVLLDSLSSSTTYLLLLLGNNGSLTAKKILEGKAKYAITFPELRPGSYSFRLIIDDDKNHVWTPGTLKNKLLPERVFSFPEPVIIKPEWETEVELKIKR